jgi:hypothetical protein
MKVKNQRHGSRSTSKGRIAARCPCGGNFKVVLSDHYNFVAECDRGCGNIREEHRMPGGISLFDMDRLRNHK